MRKFTKKHWAAVAETARGYELVIEAIDEKKSIGEIRETIRGFGKGDCMLCNSTPTCGRCIYALCMTGDNTGKSYSAIRKFNARYHSDTKALRRAFAARLKLLNKLVDDAGYVLEDVK